MSKAFTKDDVSTPETEAPLPVGRRPITEKGLAQLRAERQEAEDALREAQQRSRQGDTQAADRAPVLAKRLMLLERKIKLADVIPSSAAQPQRVALGTSVRVREDDSGHERRYTLVGPDEVDHATGRVTVASPVGQALLGLRVGQRALIKRPRGLLEVWVVSIENAEEG